MKVKHQIAPFMLFKEHYFFFRLVGLIYLSVWSKECQVTQKVLLFDKTSDNNLLFYCLSDFSSVALRRSSSPI